LSDISGGAITPQELQYMLVSRIIKGLVSRFTSDPTEDPHSRGVEGRDRLQILGQPSFRTEVKPGEKQSVGEAQPEASIEARVGENAMSELRI
jgi:hypothetical protein